MHVVVTGGAGFIGSHLVEHHLSKGDKVHAVDNLSTGTLNNVQPFAPHPGYRFTQADILTWPDLDKAMNWADRVYHMAAVVGVFRVLEDPVGVLAVNIAGTERVLRAVKAGGWRPHVIVASSSEVYGQGQEGDFQENSQLAIESGATSRWNYAVSKLADEAFGLSYAREKNGQAVTIVRLFNTIGPRQTGRYGMVVPRFVEQALAGGPIRVFGDGTQTRAFSDVRDTVVALDLLASNPASAGEIVNVGNNQEISIKALAERIRKLAGSTARIELVPYHIAYGVEFDDIRRRSTSFSKLHGLTGFRPKWRLDDTLLDLIAARKGALAVAA
jgi:UDP-glucose 4-epimerase